MNIDYDDIVNGEWKQRTNIPDTLSEWGTFIELQENNISKIIDIYSDTRLKDIFNNFVMLDDTKAMIKLCEIVDIIDQIHDLHSLGRYIGFLAKLSVYPFFYIGVKEDQNENTIQKLTISHTSVSLPFLIDTNDNNKCNKAFSYYESDIIMTKYKNTIIKLLNFYNMCQHHALRNIDYEKVASDTVTIETMIYKSIKPLEKRRKWAKYYNSMTIDTFSKLYDNEDYRIMINNIFLASETNHAKTLIVYDTEYFKALYDIITVFPLSAIKNYIKYVAIVSLGQGMVENIDKILFPLFGQMIEGTKQLHTRKRRIHDSIQQYRVVSDILGKAYVERYFDRKKEEAVKDMFDRIKSELKKMFKKSQWMQNNTIINAIKKIDHMKINIGYPKTWNEHKDFYKTIENDSDAFTKYCNIRLYSFWNDVIDKMDKRIEPYKWSMATYEVNAYYNPTRNEIVIPAGILQQPFFDINNSISQNYGFIGCILGHELIHGFDDQGRKYDYEGNIKDWWTIDDESQYKKITHTMIQQYNEYNINGSQVIGEAIADLGGVKLALGALCDILKTIPKTIPKTDHNMKNEINIFFSSYAKIWRKLTRDEKQKVRNISDLHSPEKYRIYVLRNIDEFYDAANISNMDKMYLSKDGRIQLF